MSVYRISGELMLGSRLRRLGEKFFFDISKVYKSEDIAFEPTWFPLFFLLKHNKTLTVSDIATSLEITHPGASQMITTFENRSLINCSPDKKDKRVRVVSLTKKGEALLKQIEPIWLSVQKCAQEMLNEGENSRLLFSTLTEIEDLLTKKSFFDRVKDDIHTQSVLDKISIVPYSKKYAPRFKELVLSWLIENSERTIEHEAFINDTEKTITSGNTSILFVKLADELIGLSVLAQLDNDSATIAVFHIEESVKDLHIANLLLSDTLKHGKAKTVNNITVTLDRKNASLISIFKECNFSLQSLNKENNTITMERVANK